MQNFGIEFTRKSRPLFWIESSVKFRAYGGLLTAKGRRKTARRNLSGARACFACRPRVCSSRPLDRNAPLSALPYLHNHHCTLLPGYLIPDQESNQILLEIAGVSFFLFWKLNIVARCTGVKSSGNFSMPKSQAQQILEANPYE